MFVLSFYRFETESLKLREQQQYTRDKRKAALMEKLSDRKRKRNQQGQNQNQDDEIFEIDEIEIEKEANRLIQLEVNSFNSLLII